LKRGWKLLSKKNRALSAEEASQRKKGKLRGSKRGKKSSIPTSSAAPFESPECC